MEWIYNLEGTNRIRVYSSECSEFQIPNLFTQQCNVKFQYESKIPEQAIHLQHVDNRTGIKCIREVNEKRRMVRDCREPNGMKVRGYHLENGSIDDQQENNAVMAERGEINQIMVYL